MMHAIHQHLWVLPIVVIGIVVLAAAWALGTDDDWDALP